MIIDRQHHLQFLEDELLAETEEFKKKYMTTAISLLEQSEEMFVGQFISFKDGEMIVKLPNTRSLPRKGEFLLCMLLPSELRSYRNWKDLTYCDLYKQRYNESESVCIWHMPAEDKRFSLVGFHKISMDFANYIKESPGVILVFAPQRPPIDYIINLKRIVDDRLSNSISQILDADMHQKDWDPILIQQSNVSDFVYNQLNLTDTMILQGPPGTGKTYMIAELCERICSEGKSVLVTALTNRALMEIAEKSALSKMLDEGRVYKTNITVDEYKLENKLLPLKHIAPISSSLVLSTFYISSGFAAELSIEEPFDYVIMDEASQALLSMFAATKKMGKKNLWVGDIHQLNPIISLNGDRIKLNNYHKMVNGLNILADNSSLPIYQLTKTYRFTQRSADYTGIFYKGTLNAVNHENIHIPPSMSKILSEEGGPTLILTDMLSGDYKPEFAIMLSAYIVSCILNDDKKKEIAVLTCMRDTTRTLQKAIIQNVGSYSNVLIDTVARIQGLTTDITIFVVPNASYVWTLEPHLFNVATSRAREHTIIIADKNVLRYPTLNPLVRKYLERLHREKSIYIPSCASPISLLIQ